VDQLLDFSEPANNPTFDAHMGERLQWSLRKLNESSFIWANSPLVRAALPHRHQQQRQFRGDDREQMTSARRAAEALFTPKPELDVQPVPDPAQSIKAHKSRVLPVLPPAPIRQESVNVSATSEPATAPKIPANKSARLRTLVKYGMTISQVAEVYQVPIETIERMLRKS
jgi:hypothetical protein